MAGAVVVVLNAFAGPAVHAMLTGGLAAAAVALFGVSAVQWAAFAALIALLRQEGAAPPQRLDAAVLAVVVILAMVPLPRVPVLGLTLFGAYAVATSGAGQPVQRAGLLMLGLATTLLWGPVLLIVFGKPLLAADAALVHAWAGGLRHGNTISNGDWRIIVGPGCSSLHGISLTLLLWLTVAQFYRVPPSWRQLGWCCLAVLATIGINCLRIGGMVGGRDWFLALHEGWGVPVSMWATLLTVSGLCLYAGRDAIFARD